MVLENPVPPLAEWFPQALSTWMAVAASLMAVVTVVGYFIAAVRFGPISAGRKLAGVVCETSIDLVHTSPRRTMALARLAVKEALSRRILVAFAVFAVVLLFAGWFLAGGGRPARLYLNSILFWQMALVLGVSFLLSVFSLPADIKNRTIFTVVTKPVRASEIVLGRTLGFTFVGTALLAAMGILGYVFVVRMMDHAHAPIADELTDLKLPPAGARFDETAIVQEGRLTAADDHRHTFRIDAAGQGTTDNESGHWHGVARDVTPVLRYAKVEPGDATRVHLHFSEPMDPVESARPGNYVFSGGLTVKQATISEDNRQVTLVASGKAIVGATAVTVGGTVRSRIGRELSTTEPTTVVDRDLPRDDEARRIAVGGPIDLFRARVPIYGHLQFKDKVGAPKARGISVGNEWAYRSFIEGASQAAATWTFEDIDESRFGELLPLEITVRVFRTHKGRLDRTVRGSIVLRNPDRPQVASKPRQFLAKDGTIDQQYFARRLKGTQADGENADLDLFRDLVADGRLLVELQCLESNQFYGVAQADAYLLAREASFELNYVKACVGIWVQMVLVIALGVMYSTLLSGPVAMLATAWTVVHGFFADFVAKIAANEVYGGGPMENAYRLDNQMNLMTKLPPGLGTDLMQMGDTAIQKFLWCMARLIPDFSSFSRVDYLADGFAIPGGHVAIILLTGLGYLLPAMLAGHVLLKTREVAL